MADPLLQHSVPHTILQRFHLVTWGRDPDSRMSRRGPRDTPEVHTVCQQAPVCAPFPRRLPHPAEVASARTGAGVMSLL